MYRFSVLTSTFSPSEHQLAEKQKKDEVVDYYSKSRLGVCIVSGGCDCLERVRQAGKRFLRGIVLSGSESFLGVCVGVGVSAGSDGHLGR